MAFSPCHARLPKGHDDSASKSQGAVRFGDALLAHLARLSYIRARLLILC